jgi:hypothetical protein
MYLRLLWLIPGAAMLAVGAYQYFNVVQGGRVQGIQISTKPGMVGEAAEAYQNVRPDTPDFYLRIFVIDQKDAIATKPFKDRPLGNGLTWDLDSPLDQTRIKRVEVVDKGLIHDTVQDQITPHGWAADGQRFHFELIGEPNEPPKWSLPIAGIGGAIMLLTVLRFVWDQVI